MTNYMAKDHKMNPNDNTVSMPNPYLPQPLMMLPNLKRNSDHLVDDDEHQTKHQDQITKLPKISATHVRLTIQICDILQAIQTGHKIMIIMRGAPGCGKTYFSRDIIDKTMNGDYANHIFSTSDYFVDETNRYVYDRSKLSDAHEFNQKRVLDRTANGWSPIIVDNTMIQVWEMYEYVELGIRHGYLIQIVEVCTPWAKSATILADKNCHGVPREKIQRMLRKYEKTTLKNIMKKLKLHYECIMPQMKCNPPSFMINDDQNWRNDAGWECK